MHPVLLTLGPIKIYSFGFMLAVAVIVCSWLMARDAERQGLSRDSVFDFVFWVALSGILGARIFYILLDLDYFLGNPTEMWKIQNGGLAWQGGLILGFITSIIFLKIKKLPLLRFLDLASPYAALGQAIGRIGCFLNGCCHGRHWEHGFFSPAHQDVLYPTQIFESIGLLAVFVILRGLNMRLDRPGKTLASYLMMAAALRFVVQFFRYDYDPIFLGIGLFQIVCVVVFIVSAVFYFTLKKI